MNMNKKDRKNIEKIEALRARLVNEEKERGGLVLHIDGRAVEISIERDGRGKCLMRAERCVRDGKRTIKCL